jgi:hypothetical protein
MEREPQPEFNFPWQEDEDGPYLLFRTNMGVTEIRPWNTEIYLFSDYPEANHVWHEPTECEDDDVVRHGFRLDKEDTDKAIGEGAFEAMVWTLQQHDFFTIEREKPEGLDWDAFIEKYGREPEPINRIEKVVELAMRNIDAEWEYMQGEEGWQ